MQAQQGFTLRPNYVGRIVFAESPHSDDDTGEYFIVAQNEQTLYGIQMIGGLAWKIDTLEDWKIAHALDEDERARQFANELLEYEGCDESVAERVNANGRLILEAIDRRARVNAEAFKELSERSRREMTERSRHTVMGVDVGKGVTAMAFDVEIKGIEGGYNYNVNPNVASRGDVVRPQAVGDIKISFEPGNNIGRLVVLKVSPGSFGEDGKYIVVGATRDTLLCVRVNKGYVPSVVTPVRHSDYEVVEVIQDENAVRGIVAKFEKTLADFAGIWDREVRRGVVTNISLIWQSIHLRRHAPGQSARRIAAELQSELRRGRMRL